MLDNEKAQTDADLYDAAAAKEADVFVRKVEISADCKKGFFPRLN
ncbi:hypothetical protein [Mesorhizobium sp. B263B2A]|nr:hypothetical protein [Mesorhizobium sp. B263B2A]